MRLHWLLSLIPFKLLVISYILVIDLLCLKLLILSEQSSCLSLHKFNFIAKVEAPEVSGNRDKGKGKVDEED